MRKSLNRTFIQQ